MRKNDDEVEHADDTSMELLLLGRWKKRPLMEATNFLNIRMKALMPNLQMY